LIGPVGMLFVDHLVFSAFKGYSIVGAVGMGGT
jgi:hypothetical protein